MNRNSEAALVSADAFVMFYDNILGKWSASGVSKTLTIAKVELLQNITSNQFRIFSWNSINKEVLVNSVLYHNLRYQKAHATFHEWRDSDTHLVYGLHFADSKDALLFGDVISRVFKSLELIYQQCRDLQAQIKATSLTDQYSSNALKTERLKLSNSDSLRTEPPSVPRMSEYSSYNATKEVTVDNDYVKPSDPISIAMSSTMSNTSYTDQNTNTDNDTNSTHTYENVNNILLQFPARKSLLSGLENAELRCQSSSDDSVHGLKGQPSSSSSGYATIASVPDENSPNPFSILAEGLKKCVSESKTKNQNVINQPPDLISHTDANASKPISSSFTADCHNGNHSRILSQPTARNDEVTSPNFHHYNSQLDTINPIKSDRIPATSSTMKETQSFVDPRSSIGTKMIPVDDIMSEMKIKLQRRKQLIEGHADPDDSSSTDKSDVCNSCASDAGSFVGNMDQTVDHKVSSVKLVGIIDGSNSKNKLRELSIEKNSRQEIEVGCNQSSEDGMDGNEKIKRSTGDIIQSSTSTTVLASKQDLDRIRREITDDLRRELIDVKKEVLNAIRQLRRV